MERLTYKFPSLTLANFALNAIRKDKVGEVTNSQNGYITVETANIPAVKQIVEGVRGSEIFRESIEEAFKSSSVPAGASQEVHDKARRDNPYKVRLNKGVPAGARDEEAEIKIAEFIISGKTNSSVKITKDPTNKKALLVTSGGSPRQISKSDFMSFINSYNKRNPKGKEHYSVDFDDGTYDFRIGETWQKLFLGNSISPGTADFRHTYPKTPGYHDWLQSISKSAITEEVEIEEKTKLTPDQLKKMNQGLKGKILDKKNAKKEDMEESAMKAALEDFMYALPKAAIAELRPVMKMKQGVGRMAKITSVLKKHGITQKFMGAYPTSVVNDYFDTFHGESVEESLAQPDEKVIGIFYEKTQNNVFEYRMSTDPWGKSHGLPHEVCVGPRNFVSGAKVNWRAANVKATVCYIAVDELEDGKPDIDKWNIKKHFKYVKAN
jgi:hypothetical protein